MKKPTCDCIEKAVKAERINMPRNFRVVSTGFNTTSISYAYSVTEKGGAVYQNIVSIGNNFCPQCGAEYKEETT